MTASNRSFDDAVLLLAYGGPASIDEVEQFMCELLGTRPSDEVIDRVRRHYLSIGGRSPLPETVSEFAAELESSIVTAGTPIPVDIGFRYTSPRIADTLAAMYEGGVRRVVTVALSPFESKTTTAAYRGAVRAALEDLPDLEVIEMPLLSEIPEFLELHAGLLSVALTDLHEAAQVKVLVVFSAHSLPAEDLDQPSDPYVNGLHAACDRVAARVGLQPGMHSAVLPGIDAYGSVTGARPWLLAYQSKGRRGGEWLGPSLEDVIDAAAEEGYSAIAVCPIGFATEHLETLHDLDIAAADHALGLDMEFVRSATPGTHQTLVLAVGDHVRSLLGLDDSATQ